MKIKVKHCGLNPRDVLLLQGKIEAKVPFIPGYEVSGEVLEINKGDLELEDEIEVGDKVVALTKSSLGGLSSHCIALEKVRNTITFMVLINRQLYLWHNKY